MNCSRYIVVLLAAFGLWVSPQAARGQTSSLPFIGIDNISGFVTGADDTLNLNQTYQLGITIKNYVPNSAFFGPVSVYMQTDVGDAALLPTLELVSDFAVSLTPNDQTDSIVVTYQPQPQYFVFGGGITTVVVWPMVNAPTDEPYILQVYTLSTTAINEENVATQQLSLFPNPVNEQMAIVLKNRSASITHYKIFNLNGQLVADEAQPAAGKNYVVANTANLTAGMYCIEVETTEGTVRRKFVKM